MVSRKILVLSVLFTVFFVFSCKKDKNKTSNNTQTQIQTNVNSGSWRITKFIDSGTDETNHFTDFNFIFNPTGVLNVNNGVTDYSGSWSVTDSNSNDDTQSDLSFNIHFNLTNDFEDLNDDWKIVSYSSTKVELTDVSGGNGGTDYLTFEKN
jgi:hypothetical protein